MNTDKQGVYAIRNIANGKVYIGSTANSFRERWQCHKKRLRQGQHHNKHLQAAWNKYGENNFSFEIIELTSPEDCLQREGFYIQFYKSLNPKYGYNVQVVDETGKRAFSTDTRKKISVAAKKQWKEGKGVANFKKDVPSWNKGVKCRNISETRRQMFTAIQVYKNNILVATFRSATDLDEWTRNNELPGLTYYSEKKKRVNKGFKTTHLLAQNIHRAIRNGVAYRGLIFKKSMPLPPEMGVVKWENCWKGVIPNQQPSQQLKALEGSETNG